MPLLQSLQDTYRRRGPINGSWFIVHRLLGRLTGGWARVHRYYVVVQPVRAGREQGMRAVAGSTVSQVDRDDPIVAEFPRPAEVIANRFDQGSLCYVAQVKGRFAGYLWLAFGSYEEDEVRCRFEFDEPATSAWDFDVYVAPDFRLGRTFTRLWDAANRELASRGIKWTFSRIDAFNARSIGAHRRMGMEPLNAATFVCLGALQIAFFGAAPYFHISWGDRYRPLLKLHTPGGA